MTAPISTPLPVFDHLLHISDRRGTFEHALLAEPERSGGYCTDDMARLLVVATRQPDPDGAVNGLAGLAVRYLNDAQSFAGTCRSRMDGKGHWLDEPTLQVWWGRCLWALGTAAAHSSVGLVRRLSVIQFERAAKVRSPFPEAMAYAALGAAEILSVEPGHAIARALLIAFVDQLPESSDADPVAAEAMIAAGSTLHRQELCQRGLDMLSELLDGALTGERQPVDVAALADACARAAVVDASAKWPDGVRAAASWFEGVNDSGTAMWDPTTGGGFDGPQADGVSPNQGAAATLAVLSTLQHAQRFSTVSE
jgi:hypothetical protein